MIRSLSRQGAPWLTRRLAPCLAQWLAPGAALAALALAASGAAPAAWAHDNIAKIETVAGGAYTIMVGLMSDPPFVGAPLEVTIGAAHGTPTLEGATVTLTGLPGLGTDAVPTRPVPLTLEEGETEFFEGKVTLPVRGAWLLRFEVAGRAGAATAILPVTVAAPHALPVWQGWLIALSPLLGLAWFGGWNRRYWLRLKREAALGG